MIDSAINKIAINIIEAVKAPVDVLALASAPVVELDFAAPREDVQDAVDALDIGFEFDVDVTTGDAEDTSLCVITRRQGWPV